MSIIFDVSLNPTFIRMIAPIIVALMEEDERGERRESEQTIKRRKRRLRFVHICLDSKRTMCVVLLFCCSSQKQETRGCCLQMII